MIDKRKAAKNTKKQYDYINQYQKEKYQRVVLLLDKQTGTDLEKIKTASGKSYTELLRPAIEELILANTKNNNDI